MIKLIYINKLQKEKIYIYLYVKKNKFKDKIRGSVYSLPPPPRVGDYTYATIFANDWFV